MENKKNNFVCKLIFISIIFIMTINIIHFTSSLGVTPGLRTIDYEANLDKKIDFSVINSEKKNMNIVIFVQGELNDSIYLSNNSFYVSSDEDSVQLSYEIKLNRELGPGDHGAEIVVMELPEKTNGQDAIVGTALAVVSNVNVVVPYPGKFISADLNVNNAKQGDNITMVIPVESMGDLDIVNVRGNIDIYNSMYEKVGTINTQEISLKSKERAELVGSWSAGVPPGTYQAVATVIYDGETIKLTRDFNVGQNDLELQEVDVKNFKLGDIAKFEMLVENKWGDTIKDVYAQTQVFNSKGQVMADFKSPTYDIDALSKKVLTSYWDTGGVSVGTYDASVFLRYGDKSSQKDLKLKVSEDSLEVEGLGYVISGTNPSSSNGNSTTTLLVIIIGILILLNVVWFLIVRKKLSSKK